MHHLASTDTRPSLLLRLRDNDDAAWRDFFRLYTPIVYGYAMRRGVQPNDAEDITQEVMVEVTRCIRNFEYQPDRGRFRDWLGMIAYRRLGKLWRGQPTGSAEFEHEADAGQVDPAWIDEFQAVILKEAMHNIRGSFAEVTWQLFLATWQEGSPSSEVAERFNVAIEVVYNAKSRVLKQLEAEVVRISDDCAWLSH